MKNIILILFSCAFVLPAMAFRGGGGGGGGFRGGGGGFGVGSGNMGSRGNSVPAVRSAPISANYHGHAYGHYHGHYHGHYPVYYTSYWGWYGYAPYNYYYSSTTYTEVKVDDKKASEVGTVVPELPDDCESKTINNSFYKKCGINWFEPRYSGSEIEYIIIMPPVG